MIPGLDVTHCDVFADCGSEWDARSDDTYVCLELRQSLTILGQYTPISSDVSGARIFAPSIWVRETISSRYGMMDDTNHARRAGASSTISPTRRLGGPFFS
jgi:hypothetical protein